MKVEYLDLTNLSSIAQFVSKIDKAHVLVNNAGAMFSTQQMVSSCELTSLTNHIGPFYLTKLMLDKLQRTAKEDQVVCRVINVASRLEKNAYPNKKNQNNEKNINNESNHTTTNTTNSKSTNNIKTLTTGAADRTSSSGDSNTMKAFKTNNKQTLKTTNGKGLEEKLLGDYQQQNGPGLGPGPELGQGLGSGLGLGLGPGLARGLGLTQKDLGWLVSGPEPYSMWDRS